MWEAIASNRRRSQVLISLMGVILVVLGAVIGAAVADLAFAPRPQEHAGAPLANGALAGAGIAVLIWLILWATAAGAGDGILLRTAKALEIQKEDAPRLWNIVEEMTIASGLGRMPRVYIIDDSSLNAFAVGYRPDSAAVAVTAGLLKRLSRDELQGVIAHEIAHIRNMDVRFMTLAAVMVGAIVLVSDAFLRVFVRGGAGRRRSGGRGGGQAQLVLLLIAIVIAILAPLAAQLLYFACSRRREHLADAASASFTRYPEGLASALEKISGQTAQQEINRIVAPLCIVNPLQERSLFRLFSTHPPTEERIHILRSMAGAGLAAYEAAYRRIRGSGARCVGPKTLAEAAELPIRAPAPEQAAPQQAVERARAVGELLEKVLPLVVIPCRCGVKLKLTPDFKGDTLKCPRCGRQHEVPRVEAAAAGPQSNGSVGPAWPTGSGRRAGQPLRYRRRATGWESFQCACGHPVQLSPKFAAPWVECNNCKRRINVTPVSERSASEG